MANRGFIENTLDLLSIPEYVIKKGRPHGRRCGKTPENKKYHLAHSLKKRCIKRKFTGIHDRFLRDPDLRKSMLEHDRDDDVCRKWDDLQNKISPIECENQNIFITDKIGGSLSISLGNRHRVLPPLRASGVDSGGLPKNSKKVNERGCMQRFMIERGNPLSTDL